MIIIKEFIEKIFLLYLLYSKNYIIISIFIDTLNKYIEKNIIDSIQKLTNNNDIDFNNEINTTYLI
tara:strand:+ start:2031 stop:2228 length:198 start_codon:yes stop_codon:yes gene_type:complete